MQSTSLAQGREGEIPLFNGLRFWNLAYTLLSAASRERGAIVVMQRDIKEVNSWFFEFSRAQGPAKGFL